MGNIHVKLYEICISGSGQEMSFKEKVHGRRTDPQRADLTKTDGQTQKGRT